MQPRARTRRLTIVAQDPAVRVDGAILTAQVDVPVEELAPGPWGHRVHVIDYDASANTLYEPLAIAPPVDGYMPDPFVDPDEQDPARRRPSEATILGDPKFHAQNVYAIVMRTLARFEFALGRLKAVKVNVDQAPRTAERLGVQGIPTLLVLRDGREVARRVGAVPPAALLRWAEEVIARAAA